MQHRPAAAHASHRRACSRVASAGWCRHTWLSLLMQPPPFSIRPPTPPPHPHTHTHTPPPTHPPPHPTPHPTPTPHHTTPHHTTPHHTTPHHTTPHHTTPHHTTPHHTTPHHTHTTPHHTTPTPTHPHPALLFINRMMPPSATSQRCMPSATHAYATQRWAGGWDCLLAWQGKRRVCLAVQWSSKSAAAGLGWSAPQEAGPQAPALPACRSVCMAGPPCCLQEFKDGITNGAGWYVIYGGMQVGGRAGGRGTERGFWGGGLDVHACAELRAAPRPSLRPPACALPQPVARSCPAAPPGLELREGGVL